jgi:hypothetical protein
MKVLILGGYGNFGKRIAELLTRQGVGVIVAGRDAAKAAKLAAALPAGLAEPATFDVTSELPHQLERWQPGIVINTCGPFQGAGYGVARTCIAAGVHYIDLADGRDFVAGIAQLDDEAKGRNVAVVSGASTVPALSSAVIEHVLPRFRKIHSLDYGISPGQKTERGLATTQAILGYVGRRLRPCAGFQVRYGWQDLHVRAYPDIGRRWMSNCEIPDLDLLPAKYGVQKIRFSAGMELSVVHLGLWLLSWAVRLKFPFDLPTYAPALLETSLWFDRFGSADGGMHMIVEGENHAGQRAVVNWFIIARSGDGPYIPAVPAVVLVKKFVAGRRPAPGAVPCVGLITLQDYLDELHGFDVNTYEFTDH